MIWLCGFVCYTWIVKFAAKYTKKGVSMTYREIVDQLAYDIRESARVSGDNADDILDTFIDGLKADIGAKLESIENFEH